VHERVKRLVEKGTIRGFGARIDWESIGWPIVAFVQVRVHGGHSNAVHTAMHDPISSPLFIIEECHRVAGEWCLLAKIRAANLLGVQEFGDWVRSKPGVTAVTSTIVLSTIIDQGGRVPSPNGNGNGRYVAGRN
jgi:Lrp/AsnC family leucine-responsive transcriptional regulator